MPEIKRIDRTNIATGSTLILASLGEIAVTRSVCPICIVGIGSGAAMIAREIGLVK